MDGASNIGDTMNFKKVCEHANEINDAWLAFRAKAIAAGLTAEDADATCKALTGLKATAETHYGQPIPLSGGADKPPHPS